MWNRGSRSGWKAFSWISIWTESQQLRTQQVLLQNPWSPGLYGCKWHMEGVSQIGGTCWLSEALKTSVPLDSTSLSLLFWDTLQFCKCVYVVFLLFFIFFFQMDGVCQGDSKPEPVKEMWEIYHLVTGSGILWLMFLQVLPLGDTAALGPVFPKVNDKEF